jgi:hypothetical protein
VNTAKKRPDPVQHTFSLTVAIDPFWVEYLTQNVDIFGQQYAGYWLRGVEHDPELGWLVWEDDERHRNGDEPNRREALEVWIWGKGLPLPKGWYRLDRVAAVRAWEEGVKRWGVGWYAEVDAPREDLVVQLALLGEVRYG